MPDDELRARDELHASRARDAELYDRAPVGYVAMTAPGTIRERRLAAAEALHGSERFALATLDALSAHVAILDEAGVIVDVNHAWRDFARANHATIERVCEGADYLAVCDAAHGDDEVQARQVATAIRAIIKGEQSAFSVEYPCHSPDEQRWFQLRATSFFEGSRRVVVAHENITARRLADLAQRESREQLRALAARLQEVREEERTRVAREIHDVLAQDLTRLKIDLVWLHGRLRLSTDLGSAAILVPRVLEMSRLADATIHNVQRIATELRPPVLDSLRSRLTEIPAPVTCSFYARSKKPKELLFS